LGLCASFFLGFEADKPFETTEQERGKTKIQADQDFDRKWSLILSFMVRADPQIITPYLNVVHQ